MSSDLPIRFEEGLLEPGDFFRRFSALLDLEVDYPEFCDLYSSIFLPETLIPESLLAGLRPRGAGARDLCPLLLGHHHR